MPTPHNEAALGSIAKTVLMPGDPRRSQFIAETFLKDPKLVNNVRGVHGYTGTWKGVPVTVMASGMGIPSIGIYSWELYSEYNVENIIRVGSAGALQDDLALLDVILAQGACTTSSYIENFGIRGTFAPIADFSLLSAAKKAAEDLGINVHIGNLLSSDNFYSAFDAASGQNQQWKQMGVLGIEMEGAALYLEARRCGRKALVICTISNDIISGVEIPAEERQSGFMHMAEVALELA